MNVFLRKTAACLLAAVVVITGSLPASFLGSGSGVVYGAANIKIEQAGGYFAKQGAKNVYVTVNVTNNSATDVANIELEMEEARGITVVDKARVLLNIPAGKVVSHGFRIDVSRSASVDDHRLTVNAYEPKVTTPIATADMNVSVSQDMDSQLGAQSAAFDVAYTLSNPDGIQSGGDNLLTLELFNRGNTLLKNVRISLGLPEGISINNSAGSVNAGYIAIGDRYTAKFPLTVEGTLTGKNYPVVVKVNGLDGQNAAQTIEQTLYIPVLAGNGTLSMDNVELTNISIPNQVPGGEDFTLSFGLTNRGTKDVSNVKVTATMPEGLVNKTKNVFSVSKLPKGSTQNFSVTVFCPDKTTEKFYSIQLTAESAAGDKGSGSVSQFAGTLVKNGGGNVKTPQLMVSTYNFGGSYVQAGEEFALSLGLYNTSQTHDLRNIKVTVTSDDGTFIPVKSSNSFFVDAIAAKKRTTEVLRMTSKRDAEQKTVSLTVDMAYEDGSGNAFTSKDTISIPIMQETRLVVDDVLAPPELYPGMQTGVSLKFYNMGKTTLNNLRVDVTGDFDAPQSNLYYVGNMEKGKSDSYDFSFIPKAEGELKGVVTFSYEDAAGKLMTYERPFTFTVMPPMPMDEGGMAPPEEVKKPIPWVPIGVGAWVLVAAVAFVIYKKRHKKKMEQEMEIDE